jgi:GTP cyclohydrolase I
MKDEHPTDGRAAPAAPAARAAPEEANGGDQRIRALSEHFHDVLSLLGEDPDREGLLRTPQRVARSLAYLTNGYALDASAILSNAVFASDTDEMVVVKDIEIYSLCEHHLLPFFGRAHVAYLPARHIVGLSKLARIVDVFARRLQVQERMTTQIASAVNEALKPQGVGVVVEAQHLCMMMRGVAKQNSSTVTSCMLGRFRSDVKTRHEFLEILAR